MTPQKDNKSTPDYVHRRQIDINPTNNLFLSQPDAELVLTLMLKLAEEESRNKNKYMHP